MCGIKTLKKSSSSLLRFPVTTNTPLQLHSLICLARGSLMAAHIIHSEMQYLSVIQNLEKRCLMMVADGERMREPESPLLI